jgi:tetratricopeptide (TPR) repeat protein
MLPSKSTRKKEPLFREIYLGITRSIKQKVFSQDKSHFLKVINMYKCSHLIFLILMLMIPLFFSFSAHATTEQEIKSLISKCTELKNAGKYQKAIPFAQKLLDIREKALGLDHPDTAESLVNLALLYEEMGNYAAAEPLFIRALAIREKALGPDHPDTATSLGSLAVLYDNMGNYSKAEPLYKRALAIREKVLGPDHPDTATSLNNLAELYSATGNYAEAELLFKRALAINEKVLDPDHPDIATSLNNLAGLYYATGNYAEAEPLYKRALAINEKVLGPDHPDTATSLNNLAELYSAIGNYAKAELLFKRALATREKALGPDHPDTATSLNNLAGLYYATGNYAKAELLFKRALATREKALGPNHDATATSMNNLAALHCSTGNYAEAELLFKRALAINEKALGHDHPNTAVIINNLAELYKATGNYAEAEPLCKRALVITEKALGPNHRTTAVGLSNLAGLYYATGNYAGAAPLFKRASVIIEKALGRDHPDTITSFNNLVAMYCESGKLMQAREILTRINSPVGWGYYHLAACEFDKAELVYKKLIDNSTGSTEGDIARYIGLGLACEGQNKYGGAKDAFQKAVELTEKHYATLTFGQRQTYFTSKVSVFRRIEPYEGMVRVLLKEKAPGCEAQALWYAERAKSRILQEMLAVRELGVATVEDKRILEKDREFQRQLIVLNKRIEVLQGMGDKAPRGEVPKLSAELEAARVKYEAFLQEVKLANSEVASFIGAQPPTVKEMQALLDDGMTVLAYYSGKDTTWAWLVTKTSVKVFELAPGGKEDNQKSIQNNVDGWLAMNVSTRNRAAEGPILDLFSPTVNTLTIDPIQLEHNRQEFLRRSSELYAQFVAPVLPEIKTKKLVIVPHGVLHKVPFACLSDGSQALVDRFDLSFAPSLSAVEFIVKKRKNMGGSLTAFANPATDQKSLPFAEAEVGEIKPLFATAQVFSRAEATEGKSKNSTGSSDVVHFACHGEFNDRQPLQSGLLLSADADNDGVLQVHEIFGMNLRKANLITLSACETALCKVRGGEDWVGLSRGFIYAGTPSILATLWSVDDKSTAIVMKNFYSNWLKKGMTKPAALRQAQLSLKAIPEYSHPFYWAPFVMIGDWR